MRAPYRTLLLFIIWLHSPGIAQARLAELLVNEAGATKPINLEAAAVTAEVDLSTARITYDLTFASARAGAQEATFYFALPRSGYVHEFGLWIDGRYQSSVIVEAQTGRVAYETIQRRGVDPALLEWTAGNTFKMRVYPVAPHKPTRVRLTVGLPLSAAGERLTASFPVDLGKVASFSFKVSGRVNADRVPALEGLKDLRLSEDGSKDGILTFQGSYAAKAYLPPDEVRLFVQESEPAKLKVRREDGADSRYFEARVFPDVPSETRPTPAKVLVYWDYSLSEEEHLDARLHILKQYLAARKPQAMDIYGFSQGVFSVAQGLKGADWPVIEAAIRRHPYDGGTRLDLLADRLKEVLAPAPSKVTDLVLFTNGVDSYEFFDFKRVKDLGQANLHAFIVTPSNGGNAALIQRFATALKAVVVDEEQTPAAAMFTALPWQITSVKHSPNLKSVEKPGNRALFPGTGLILRGLVKKDGQAELTVTMTQGAKTKVLSYAFDADKSRESSGAIERLWALARIQRFLAEKRQHAAEIKALALKHQLLSPFTALVVLEYCEDYAEFKLSPPATCVRRIQDDAVHDLAYESDEADEADDLEAVNTGGTLGPDESGTGGQQQIPLGEDLTAAPTGPLGSGEDFGEAFGTATGDHTPPMNDWSEEAYAFSLAPEKDTPPRSYGFEAALTAQSLKGANALYAEYVRTRRFYQKIPYYYIFAADLFARLKRTDLASLVLSNVVEVRPGDARWLRVYAYNLVAWGKAKEAVPLYRAVSELREEDPQSFRDFGLALEAVGQPVAAMELFERVYLGHWDARLEGMSRIIRHDLTRAALAALKTPGLTPEIRAKATEYAKADASRDDKIVVTVSWDTDNTDIDLHVVEPNGAHVFFANMAPKDAGGRLSYDTTRGFGPEQYRSARPYQGKYRLYLRYYSSNPSVIQDGTFARVDVKIVENGAERLFTKTVFLKDQEEVRTVLTFDYKDKNSPRPPPNFRSGLADAQHLLDAHQYSLALKTLESLGARSDPREEAQRYFHLARAQLGLKRFDLAEQSNQRALALDPNLLAAHFNNACAGALGQDVGKAIFHLNLLADSLARHPEQRQRFLKLMVTDPDLSTVRGNPDFNAVIGRIKVGH